MNRVKAFGDFWYEFIVGDDWRIAAAVVVGLGVTALLAHATNVAAWWVLPTGVVAGLSTSLWLATRPPRGSPTADGLDGSTAIRADEL